MTSASTFDRDSYLAAYAPQSLPRDQWHLVRDDVLRMVRSANPSTQIETRGLLSALTGYLERVRGSADASVQMLNLDGLGRFTELKRADGMDTGSLGNIRARLKRLLAAQDGRELPRKKAGNRSRVATLNPYSHEELSALRDAVPVLEPSRARTLAMLIALAADHGCPRRLITTATVTDRTLNLGDRSVPLDPHDDLLAMTAEGPIGVTSEQWADVVASVLAHTGIELRHHRLRHHWLLRVIDQPGSVAELMTRHGLSGDDLTLLWTARAARDLPTPPGSDADMHG